MRVFDGSKWLNPTGDKIISSEISEKVSDSGQRLNYVDFLTSWDCREYDAHAWTQGFSINEDTEEIYVSCYHSTPSKVQWVECRNYDGTLKWKTDELPQVNGDAFSEGLPYYYDGSQLCFILRLDPGGNVRTYNTVTKVLSDQIKVEGITKLFGDDKYFYCATGQPTHAILTAIHIYTLDSIKAGTPELVNTIQLDTFGSLAQDNKPQGMAVRDGNIFTAGGKYYSDDPRSGRLDLRVYNGTGRISNAFTLNKVGFRSALSSLKRPNDTIPNETSFENEGLYPLKDGRIAVMNHLHRYVYITIHGSGSSTHVDSDPLMYSNDSGWINMDLTEGILPYSDTSIPRYRRIGNIVYLQGAFKGLAEIDSGSSQLGFLPRGFRPSMQYDFMQISNGTSWWRGYVRETGGIRIVSYSGTLSASSWLPMNLEFVADGLSF